ncbi:MAG: palmitoyltransferase akr1 [Thelocarpon impressellum]|nr:MAG: palmitoyltransferase akr1 [Thelocarpon impressellum]
MSMTAAPAPQEGGAESPPPSAANGTASTAPPKPTDGENVELKDVRSSQLSLPLAEDIMQLARLGEVDSIKALFDTGKFDAKYKDEEGITPLHWAAINNQYALCKFLVEAGVDVNAKGGESVATPAMWAAQKCHYYTVNLLLRNGADPLITDVQGYNMLHLATFDGNVFLLVLLLHQNIPVDIADPHGHSSLMWAAYKGYPACVDLFLRWGANVYATDNDGFTALHWALVKGAQIYVSQACIQKLVEYGSDRFAETTTGKTPAITAEEMHCTGIWHRALAECGYDEAGNPTSSGLPFAAYMKDKRVALSRFFFLWPFFVVFCVVMILSHMVIFAAVPIAAVAAYGLQWAAQQALQWAPADMKHLHRTPYLAGCFAGLCFWVGLRWLFTILPHTFASHPFTNLLFGLSFGLCVYFYSCCVLFDPGYVPRLGGRSQEKEAIEELLGLWKFDDENFCMQCMVRRPLRSKHCKKCGRCIAKHDHTFSLPDAWLTVPDLEALPRPIHTQCNVLSDDLCGVFLKDPYTITLVIIVSLQLVWLTMLLVVQLVQIARAQTTYENMSGRNHHGSRPSEAIASAVTAGATSLEGAQLTADGHGPAPALAGPGRQHSHARDEGCFAHWKKLLGLDTFVATALGGYNGPQRMQRNRNPFSRGLVANCKDFLCDPAPVFGKRNSGAALLGGERINYAQMYESPPRMRVRSGGNALYQSVAGDDAV